MLVCLGASTQLDGGQIHQHVVVKIYRPGANLQLAASSIKCAESCTVEVRVKMFYSLPFC